VLLRALAESPELRLRVLTGGDALDRPVGGVFTTDLLDPRRYLSGGEIVLTGLMWRRAPEDSQAFVSALAGAGVAALAAGDAALGSVPPDLVEACRDHRLPLLEVPVDVSFAAITERVMRALLSAGPGPAVARLRLLAAAEAGAAPAARRAPADAMATVFTVAAAEYGVAGWVLSAAGRLVTGAHPAPGGGLRSALARACLSAPGLPATVTVDGATFSLLGVAGPSSHRLAGWFVGLAGDDAAWDDERRAVAAELAGLAAGYRARHEDARRPARRSADASLRRVLEWRAGAPEREEREIAAALRRHGLAAEDPLVAVAVAAPQAAAQRTAQPGAARPGAAQHTVQPGAAPSRAAQSPAAPPGAAQSGAAQSGAAQPGAAQPAEEPPGVAQSGVVQPDAAAEVARTLLEEMLPGALVGVCGATAVALVSGAGEVLDQVRDVVGVLAGVPGLDLPFGVSVLTGATGEDGGDAAADAESGCAAGRVSRVVAEARQARRLAELLGGGVRIVDSAQFGSYELLLAMVPGEARRAFRAALLAPLLAYDRDHGTELVSTLEVFLACSGSWSKAAEAMFIHVNSLRYRIRRIGELTGRDPRSLEDQAALLLALRM
jgi:hypothetical protein